MLRRLLALACFCLHAAGALAGPAHIDAAVPDARLLGQGEFRYFGLRIYHAQLWTGAAGYRLDAPFALDLQYARDFNGVRIADASAEQIARANAGTPAQRAQWRERMRAVFPDVKAGSHITGVFVPGGPVKFYLDGAAIGSIDDPAFGPAFAGIWLAPGTSAPRLREALLNQARQP